jgi:hypothetical protein
VRPLWLSNRSPWAPSRGLRPSGITAAARTLNSYFDRIAPFSYSTIPSTPILRTMAQTAAEMDKKSKYNSNKPTSKPTGTTTTSSFELPKNVSGITASNQRRYAEYVAGLFNTSAEVVQPREQNPKIASTRNQ